MEAILHAASDPSDLLNLTDSNLPYRFDQIFSAKGFGAKRLAKKRLKLIKEIDPIVQRFLSDGERVQFVSWGSEYSFFDQYLMLLSSIFTNRLALVITNRRLLMIQLGSRRKVALLKKQLRFHAIDAFAKKTFGYIGFVLRTGKRFNIAGIPRKDRRAIKTLVAKGLSATRTDAPGLGTENLCPNCGNKVMGFPGRCNQCTQEFGSARRASWLSLAFPGLGSRYLGYKWLGALEIFAGLCWWSAFGLYVAFTLTRSSESVSWIGLAGIAAGVFVLCHVRKSWITRRLGFKGIYPA